MGDIINKVANFGNDLFDKTVGLLNNLPGIAKGIATCLLLGLMAIGLIQILKKSFKVFGIVILVIIAIIIATSFLGK